MIAPSKYVQTTHSILGQAAEILVHRESDMSVSALWEKVRSVDSISYERFVLCLDFLFTLGLVELRDGILEWRR